MTKIPKQAYTTEFKELAVKRVADGQAVSAVVQELGLSDQTLRNWIKASATGKLKGAGSKVITPEAMELSRLRAEGLPLTLHAGEADVAERVLEAADLGATRIGHGIRFIDRIGDPIRGQS